MKHRDVYKSGFELENEVDASEAPGPLLALERSIRDMQWLTIGLAIPARSLPRLAGAVGGPGARQARYAGQFGALLLA